MKMQFNVPLVATYQEPEVKHNVDLTLEISSTDANVAYLKANGKTIMGFKNGMYCRYTDASGIRVVKGLVFDDVGKIVESHCNF
jgi:hypothetical protein